MYTPDHIFPFLPIKDLINEDGDPMTIYKLATGTKPSVSHLRLCFNVRRSFPYNTQTKQNT